MLSRLRTIELNTAPHYYYQYPREMSVTPAIEETYMYDPVEHRLSNSYVQSSTNKPEPLPLQHTYLNLPLPSEEISKTSLLDVDEALKLAGELKCREGRNTGAKAC